MTRILLWSYEADASVGNAAMTVTRALAEAGDAFADLWGENGRGAWIRCRGAQDVAEVTRSSSVVDGLTTGRFCWSSRIDGMLRIEVNPSGLRRNGARVYCAVDIRSVGGFEMSQEAQALAFRSLVRAMSAESAVLEPPGWPFPAHAESELPAVGWVTFSAKGAPAARWADVAYATVLWENAAGGLAIGFDGAWTIDMEPATTEPLRSRMQEISHMLRLSPAPRSAPVTAGSSQLAMARDRGNVDAFRDRNEAHGRAHGEGAGVVLSPVAHPETPGERREPEKEEPTRQNTTTAALSVADIERAVLPYMRGAAPATTPQSAVEELGDHPLVGETGFIQVNLDGPVLPFGRPPPAADAAAPPSPASEQSAGHAYPGDRSSEPARATEDELDEPSVDETAFMTALVIEEPMPFKAPEAGAAASPRPPEIHEPHPATGATTHITVGTVPTNTALPFAPVTPQGGVRVGDRTLQEIAALEVEIGHGIGRVPEVLAAFGLDRAQFVGLRRELERRCENDPSLKEQLEAERAAYAAWREQQTR